MEFRQIRYFVAVAEEMHFTKAARRLNVSQPPLSLQIRKLELEIGTDLFVRTGQRIALTPAGQAFLPRARRVMEEMQRAKEVAREAAEGVTGTLQIGFVASASHSIVPALIRILRSRHPKADFRLFDLPGAQQLERVTSGDLDIALVRSYSDAPDLANLLICREPFVAIVSESDPLGARASVRLADLRASGLVIASRASAPAYFDTVIRACNEAGFSPRIAHELRQIQAILDTVAAGLGVAIQPASVRQMRKDGLVFLPIEDMTTLSELRMVYAPDSVNPLTRSAREAAVAVSKELVAAAGLSI